MDLRLADEAKVRPYLRAVESVLDVGSGIRPQTLIHAKTICIEPHGPYADWLRDRGFEVIQAPALEGMDLIDHVDTVTALDVIEHMTREDGEAFLRRAVEIARQQVVIFTPLGFLPQSGDAWGMGGDYWQEHRSGWVPEDFPAWTIVEYPNFHREHGAFFAIHG